ncbi:LysR family transcriptional regulator [Bengtsoniella intestinalis]|uniref:LysR family transcriptional regulator n=1 Tax=Bengtsoniella intestinalis TaxID=3073143 RepID=UPI00391F0A2B
MTRKELQGFMAVYEYGSISKAAERLYMAQPSLTRIIKKIEQDTGNELFKRTNDGLKPTAAGELYRHSAQQMMDIYHQMDQAMSSINAENRGKLTVGTTFFLGSIVLPVILHEFKRTYPNIAITIIEGTSWEIKSEIAKGAVDVGIIHLPVEDKNIETIVLGQERFYLAVPPEDAINLTAYQKEDNRLPYIDLSLVKNRPFILTHPGQRAREEAMRICQEAGFEPSVQYTTKNLQTAANLVSIGIGFSIIPSSYLLTFNNHSLPNYYNIEEAYHPEWPLAVIYAKTIRPTKSFDAFVSLCKEVLPPIYNY